MLGVVVFCTKQPAVISCCDAGLMSAAVSILAHSATAGRCMTPVGSDWWGGTRGKRESGSGAEGEASVGGAAR